MFSNSSLDSFVRPVPICQPEAALGCILNIFQNTNSRLLAVPLNNGDWGIIYAEDVLSLVSKTWLNQLTLVGHPKSASDRSNIPQIDVRDFNSTIVPAVVYQADTELQEFLNHLSYNCLFDRRTEYLLVDRGGKLRGRLDRHKILKYLAVKTQGISTNTAEAEFLGQVSSLIDNIAVPLKIESTAGKTLHCNASWQELVMSKPAYVRQPETKSSLNTVLKQRSSDEVASPAETPPSSYDKCDRDRQQSGANNILPISDLDVRGKSTNRNLNANLSLKARSLHAANYEIETDLAAGWKLKVPLVATARQKNSDRYWLVIGGSILNRQTLLPASSSPTNESVDKLLASFTHQLKSPLTGIVGLASLLKEKQIGKLNQRQAQYANLIHSSSQNMMGIVNHILKLVSLTREKRSPKLVNLEFFCEQVYQRVLTEVKAAAPADLKVETLEPKFTLIGDKTATVDEEILFQILFHLMLEIYEADKSWQGLQVKINNYQQNPAVIEISPHFPEDRARELTQETISAESHSNLNLAIARYLAEMIGCGIDSFYSAPYCQFTLRLSNTEVQPSHKLSDLSWELCRRDPYLEAKVNGDKDKTEQRPVMRKYDDGAYALSCSIAFCPEGYYPTKMGLASRRPHLTPAPTPTNGSKASGTMTTAFRLIRSKSRAAGSLANANLWEKKTQKNLTILYLYPELEASDLRIDREACRWDLLSCLSQGNRQFDRYRIIEADSLEQAHTLASIWQLDVIILDGYQIAEPTSYLRSLLESEYLSNLPLITLDARTTEAGNQLKRLNVYPCLLPSEERRIEDLLQVIEIATES